MQVEVIPGRDSTRKVSFELAKGMSRPARSVRSAMTRRPFEQEYVAMLQRAGVKYDPEYVWD